MIIMSIERALIHCSADVESPEDGLHLSIIFYRSVLTSKKIYRTSTTKIKCVYGKI
jgi:hypothetical protein